ncbi:MAG: HlyD family efflux transporter periplasmic adaptor subunit, partial [Alphaproteobacteria bacterium]
MDQVWRRRAIWAAVILAVGISIIYGLEPEAVPADMTTLKRSQLVVTVNDEGIAKIKDVYTVSAPIPGRVLRSPLKVGDKVEKGKTTVASMLPSAPAFLNERIRLAAQASVRAAEAALKLSEASVTKAEAELRFAESDLKRAERLAPRGAIPERQLERAKIDTQTKQAGLESAKAEATMRKRELEGARANLTEPGSDKNGVQASARVDIKAPISGYVLKVTTESENVVAAGTALVDLGDLRDLEIYADLLSTDAVRIRVGAEAYIEGWGGKMLHARVTRIEPAGFKKISALGVEEQRVNVRPDLTDGPSDWGQLGHDYRVFVRIVVEKAENALVVPLSALFRR